MSKTHFLFILFSSMALAGCQGIQSAIPILGKNESDKIEEISGYWNCRDKTKEPMDLPWLVEDFSSGFLLKDYVYKATLLEQKSESKEVYLARAKKYGQTYVLQFCADILRSDNKNQHPCAYVYAIKQKEAFDIYPTIDDNLSSAVKEVLADVFVNTKSSVDIVLNDDFVAAKGKKLIETIGRTQPKTDLSDNAVASCEKITIEQARKIVDENRAKKEQNTK